MATIPTPPPATANPSATGANLTGDAAKQYIQSQIADKQAQVDALTNSGDTAGTTADITKNPDNSYSLNATGENNVLFAAMKNYTDILNAPNPADVLTANTNTAIAGLAGKNAETSVNDVQGQQRRLLAENQPQEALLQSQQTNKLNAGLQSIKNAQSLWAINPNNPANQKSTADLANEQATTQKTLADLDPNSPANQLIQSEIAKNKSDIAQANNFDGTGLSSKQVSSLQTLTDKINSDKQTVNLQNVATAVGIINGLSQSTDSSDQAAVLMGFVQALQPGASTVKSAIGPITAMLGSKGAETLLKAEQTIGNNGTLSKDVIDGIVSTVNKVYQARQKAYQTYINNNYVTPNIKNLGISDLSDRLGSVTNPPEANANNQPIATNPTTGKSVQWNGTAWVDVK